MIAIGMTGTDTGAGKTVVSCGIAAAFVRRGARVGVLKPVETGVGDTASDAHRLMRAAASTDDLAIARPYAFAEPLAPLAAARRAGTVVDIARLDASYAAVGTARDVVVVEGAGGLLVPIADRLNIATLFARWGLSVVIVAPNRLGVVNHALLTLAAARAAGVRIAAMVLSEVSGSPHDLSAGGNAALIAEFGGGVPVLSFPWVADPGDLGALADAAEAAGLLQVLAPA